MTHISLISHPRATLYSRKLQHALESLGVTVNPEHYDGYKHIDMRIEDANLDIEVDGVHHFTDPEQIGRDLSRGRWSHHDGFDTIHIPNKILADHSNDVAKALAEVVKKRKKHMHVHIK